MKKLFNYLSRHKWMLISILLLLLVLFLMTLMSVSQINGFNRVVFDLNHFIKAHKFTFLLWHIAIIGAIWVLWGKKVDQDFARFDQAHPGKLDAGQRSAAVAKAKRFRWWLIAFVLVIDLLMHWY